MPLAFFGIPYKISRVEHAEGDIIIFEFFSQKPSALYWEMRKAS
jgi:hypothetical protein